MDGKTKAKLSEEIVRAVQQRLGGAGNSDVAALIADEVAGVLGSGAPPTSDPTGQCVTVCGHGSAADQGVIKERIVVTANGRNRRGIVAGLTDVISEAEGDIRDISQTIVGDYFTMIIVVDVARATRHGSHFVRLKERLESTGKSLGVHVVALHDDILTTMHTV